MSDPEPASPEAQARAALGADFIIPALGFGLTVYYLISTVDLVWEAKATGIVIGLALLALCLVQFVRLGIRLKAGHGSLRLGELTENDAFNRQRLGLIAMAALYVVTIHWVGATVGLFLLLIGCMRLLGVTGIRALVGTAFIATALVHLALITLLDSKLPRGVLLNSLSASIGGG